MDKCNCEEHPLNPFFCPPSLVDYKSQDEPAMLDYISKQYHVGPEDIKIQDTDKSKRLDQEDWERYMAWNPVDATVETPYWARGDPVLRQNQASRSGSPSADDPVTDLANTSIEDNVVEPIDRLPQSPDTPLMQVSQSELPNTETARHTPKGRRDELRKGRPGASTKAADWRSRKHSRITKSSWKPAMGLRSRKVTTFYKLGCDGKAEDYHL
ncbi:MAG: hypothetical protein Q9200_000191 [Gallowayella weberi]